MKRRTGDLLIGIGFLIAAIGLSAYCLAQDKPASPAVKEEAKAALPKVTNEERLELRELILSGRLVSEQVDKMRAQITALQLQVEKMEPEVKKADDTFQAKWSEVLKKYGQTPGETNIDLASGQFIKTTKQIAAK